MLGSKQLLPKILFTLPFLLASCGKGDLPQNTLNDLQGAGDQKAIVTGSIVKEDGSAARNGTMVLIREMSGRSQDAAYSKSGDQGTYRFNNLLAGSYRLAFVLASEEQRKQGAVVLYDPANAPVTSSFYGFVTTGDFQFDGKSERTFQAPQMNVEWRAALQPHDTTVDSSRAIRFTWAPAHGGTGYNVDIRDANNNPFYKSPVIRGTTFSWSDLKANRGDNTGRPVEKGKVYLYLINVLYENNSGLNVVNGGSATARFTAG